MTAILLCALARAGEPLALSAVLASVADLHPQLAAESLRVDAAEGEVLAARGAFDPVLRDKASWTPLGEYSYLVNTSRIDVPTTAWGTTLYAGHSLGIGKIPDYDGEYATPSLGEVFAGIDVPLLRDGGTDRARLAVGKARFEVDAARAGVGARVIELERQAVYRYADWAAAGQRLRIAEELLALAEERGAWFRSREESGDIAAFDTLDNDRLVVQRRTREVEARRAFEKAQIELGLFWRGPDGRPVLAPLDAVPDTFPTLSPPPDDALAHGLSARPELARLDALRSQIALDARWARNQQLPALDVLGQVTVDPTGAEPLEVDSGVGFELPVLLRAARGRAEVAAVNGLRVERELELQRDRIAADVADARSAMLAADERIGQLAAELDLARALERGEVRRYELGESNLLFVNVREVATADAESALVLAHADRLRAEADRLAASGARVSAP